eukprot:m.16991 g.16991  ORF g.16991 m.16991 type:complete len:50 (+) comp7284_c0_seq2:1000-1149(+)
MYSTLTLLEKLQARKRTYSKLPSFGFTEAQTILESLLVVEQTQLHCVEG